MPDVAINFMDQKTWIEITKSVPDLSTLELHKPEAKNFWSSTIEEKSKQLTEITFSNIDQTYGSVQSAFNSAFNFTPLLNAAELCRKLRCLRF